MLPANMGRGIKCRWPSSVCLSVCLSCAWP